MDTLGKTIYDLYEDRFKLRGRNMKWQQVMPICSIQPALSRLALVQTRGGPSVMHESIGSVSLSNTPRYWCLMGVKT